MKNENDKDILDAVRSREIVSEILNFGVSQYQIKKIIKFLSLELEDMNLVKEISSIIDSDLDEDCQKSKIEI
mgnify:CR=1 FL=1|tara:strand:- start:237 stop:452 length:216 start_codon:yes stop_codon:yes gene_type:complete